MKALEPITITDAILTSSTVPEPDTGEVIYDAGDAPYSEGDVVIVDHWAYESLINTNNDVPPDQESNSSWLFLGASNRWKPFDLKRNKVSLGASPYVIEITPTERVAALALDGLVGNEVQLEVISTSMVTIYDESQNLSIRTVSNMLEYLFEPFRQLRRTAFMNLPLGQTGATYRITITGTGDVGLSALGLGPVTNLGPITYSAVDDALNFSRVTRDRDGNAVLTPGKVVPTLIPPIFADKAAVPAIRGLRSRTGGVPIFWIGLDDAEDPYYGSVFTLGFWTRFAIDLEHPDNAPLNIALESIS